MQFAYGASELAWELWAEDLGLREHLLPVVSNPLATISPNSKMKSLGKTPSKYSFSGDVVGITKWTEERASETEYERWKLQPDYGICVQSREIRAIDIDVPQKKLSNKIRTFIENHFMLERFPLRYREGTGKCLLPFRMEEPLSKRVLYVRDGAMVEILADGQQWVAEGAYLKDGRADGRYLWKRKPAKIEDIPLITMDELEELCAQLAHHFDIGTLDRNGQRHMGWVITGERRDRVRGEAIDVDDPVVDWLESNWTVHDHGPCGELYVDCPFKNQHSCDSGITETAYFPAGTNGYERGNLVCQHAGCAGHSTGQMLEAMGYVVLKPEDFPELPPEEESSGKEIKKPAVRWLVNKQGRKEARAYNHRQFLRDASQAGFELAMDSFSAKMVFRKAGTLIWQEFRDDHYNVILEQMDRCGFVVQHENTIRGAVKRHAASNPVDTLRDWCDALPEWDGLERIERFWIDYAGAEDTAYTRAVGVYSWTAQAGRALEPGCQADMALVLVGEQGIRKTSLVRAIAPRPEMFTEINLTDRDENTIRQMRGKVVAELGELRGMHRRDKEDMKSFMSRRVEEWVPKYQEFTDRFSRRFIFYGTTNRYDFLGDETGERRWLPLQVGTKGQLDVEAVERNRDQLWAEAVHCWRQAGVHYQEAERLASLEHSSFKQIDVWAQPIARWVLLKGALDDPDLSPAEMPHEWGTADVALGALRIPAKHLGHAETVRIGTILNSLGCEGRRRSSGMRYRAVDRVRLEATASEEAIDPLLI